jgi:hypothetical protein
LRAQRANFGFVRSEAARENPLGKGARGSAGIGSTSWGPKFAKQTFGFLFAAQKGGK